MNYKQTLDFLFSQLPMYQRSGKAAYKANLDNTLALDNYFHSPHKKFKSIHVAGTNGKGSVSHSLASVLQEAGYKVGLYTSPHLKDFRERIKINGQCISESEVVDFVHDHQEIIQQIKPSFFEMTVAMAFHYFATQKVDVAIIEVGLGGRLDSTNIISPDCSIITNISKDHTALLGNTIEQIAREKAGIIKPNIPVIIGESQPKSKAVFLEKSTLENAPIVFADEVYKVTTNTNSIHSTQILHISKNNIPVYDDLEIDLLGNYQSKNMCTVLSAIDILKEKDYKITQANIYNGLSQIVKNTGLLGRWQIIGNNPLMVCDTGHNKAGIALITEQLRHTAYKKLHIVIGMVNDKEIDEVLELLPQNASYYFTKPNIPRGLDAKILQEKAKKYHLQGEIYPSVSEAKKNAKKLSSPNDLIFIGGSTFVVAEAI